jgi:transcription-repair coupling factor (superfamily II helicase)
LELSGLLPLIEGMPAYRSLVAELVDNQDRIKTRALEAARPYIVAALHKRLKRPLLLITAKPERMRQLSEQLSVWCGMECVRSLPETELLAYQGAISDDIVRAERLKVLSALAFGTGEVEPLVVVAVPALVHRVTAFSDFIAAHIHLKTDMEIAPATLLQKMVAMGYESQTSVELPGSFSRRGGILDVFPPTSELPARLEFTGNSIASIRLFKPASQRSLIKVPSLDLGTAAEVLSPDTATLKSLNLDSLEPEVRRQFQEDIASIDEGKHPDDLALYAPLFNKDSILSYLPKGSLVVIDEPIAVAQAVDTLNDEVEELRSNRIARGELPPGFPSPYFNWQEIELKLRGFRMLEFSSLTDTEGEIKLAFSTAPSFAGRLPLFSKKIKEMLARRYRIVLVSHQANRLAEILAEEGLATTSLEAIDKKPQPGSLTLLHGTLEKG